MILDSTFVHDLLRNDSDAIDRLVELRDSETPVALSALTVFEVGVGLREESAQYRAEFDELVVLPVTETVAQRAIAIQHDLLDQGQRIGARNVLIAGTAVGSPDPRVLTRNVDEFARVDGLEATGY
jgi:tRNA(fMet)-specific endonuclease VapC